MYFSGKITNSVIHQLSKEGVDFASLYAMTDLPTEFLKDPSCWLDAYKVESFLKAVEQTYSEKLNQSRLIWNIGHSCHELKAWGVLDSVLKMMQKPQDIFAQPHRFISYFVSPAPPIGNLKREDESVSFDIPISNYEFPVVSEYLTGALEGLPQYVGRPLAQVKWKSTKIRISWSEAQSSLLAGEMDQRLVNPDLMQSLVQSLEDAESTIDEKKSELKEKEVEIKKLKLELSLYKEQGVHPSDLKMASPMLVESAEVAKKQFRKLEDYVVRAQQLITLLIGQDRMDPQVKEAMRRVDWSYICEQFPLTAHDGIDAIEKIKKQITDRKNEVRSTHGVSKNIYPTDLNL